MSGLIERLEKAEAGSRELDDSVWLSATDGEMMDWWDDEAEQHQIKASDGSRVNVTPVTTSLDAALALAERALPGWCFSMATITPPWVQAYPPGSVEDCLDAVAASTLPLALCIAILRAKQDPAQ